MGADRGLEMGGVRHQPHPGTRVHCCRCSLPGLTGFTMYRRGGTAEGHHESFPAAVDTALERRGTGIVPDRAVPFNRDLAALMRAEFLRRAG